MSGDQESLTSPMIPLALFLDVLAGRNRAKIRQLSLFPPSLAMIPMALFLDFLGERNSWIATGKKRSSVSNSLMVCQVLLLGPSRSQVLLGALGPWVLLNSGLTPFWILIWAPWKSIKLSILDYYRPHLNS